MLASTVPLCAQTRVTLVVLTTVPATRAAEAASSAIAIRALIRKAAVRNAVKAYVIFNVGGRRT